VDHVCVTDVCGLATFNLKSSWRNSGCRRRNTIYRQQIPRINQMSFTGC